MLLKEACPTCGKEIKSIQTSFIAMNKLHEVYSCGHLVVKGYVNSSNGQNKEDCSQITIAKDSESLGESAIQTDSLLTRDFTSNPPTKEELYDNLDRWVNEGGAVKDIAYSLPTKYIDKSFWATVDCPKYFCQECQVEHTRKHLFKYQREGVLFVERASVRCLIGDAPMLGKTPQAAVVLRRNESILTPALFLVRGATIFQWVKELKEWYSNAFSGVMPVTERIHLLPGFKAYVMSQDLLSRKGVLDLVKKLNIKLVVIDEAQFYKDTDSERCKALYKLITDLKIQYRLPLSGTYIKNRMSEAFTVLNLLDPNRFHSPIQFKNRWLIQNEKGVYTRLNPIYEKQFKELTSSYIIRRERSEVIKDLPEVTRDYQLIEITDPYVKKTYNHEIGLYESFKNDPKLTSTQILGWLAKLRQITGMAKASHCVEWTNEFLDSCDNSIMIGIHHNNVRDILYNVFQANKLNPLKLSGEDDSYRKAQVARDFSEGRNRILIINMLAGGVGTNIHNCTNAAVLEREWNSADEEQFEGRLRDLVLKKKGITITYFIAKGTIDEFFHDMVWQKRNILASAGIGNPDEETSSISFLKEFAEFVAGKKI